jgi:hypothetical protein
VEEKEKVRISEHADGEEARGAQERGIGIGSEYPEPKTQQINKQWWDQEKDEGSEEKDKCKCDIAWFCFCFTDNANLPSETRRNALHTYK